MQIKLIRIEQSSPDIKKAENEINREIKSLESKNHKIIDIKLSVVRDAAPEYKTQKSFALTAMILYN